MNLNNNTVSEWRKKRIRHSSYVVVTSKRLKTVWIQLCVIFLLFYEYDANNGFVSFFFSPSPSSSFFVAARLDGAILLPHGDEALDPEFVLPPNSVSRYLAQAIQLGAHGAAQWMIQTVQPDLIFLTSPHGLALATDFSVYLNTAANGSLTQWSYNHNESKVVTIDEIVLDPTVAESMVDTLQNVGETNVTGVKLPSDGISQDFPLEWGEIIPLKFLQQAAQQQQQRGKSGRKSTVAYDWRESKREQIRRRRRLTNESETTKTNNTPRRYLVWTFPLRRYDHAVEMVDELLRIGSKLYDYLETLPQSVGVVISGDLAHTHRADGPYGYSNTSAPFDHAISNWVDGNICDHANSLLETASSLQPTAMSCGFTGFILLHGMLCGPSRKHKEQSGKADERLNEWEQPSKKKWKGNVLVNLNATYFGMMAATLEREGL